MTLPVLYATVLAMCTTAVPSLILTPVPLRILIVAVHVKAMPWKVTGVRFSPAFHRGVTPSLWNAVAGDNVFFPAAYMPGAVYGA